MLGVTPSFSLGHSSCTGRNVATGCVLSGQGHRGTGVHQDMSVHFSTSLSAFSKNKIVIESS